MLPPVTRSPAASLKGLMWACVLSVAAHVGAVWLWWLHPRVSPDSTWSRQQGTLLVSFRHASRTPIGPRLPAQVATHQPDVETDPAPPSTPPLKEKLGRPARPPQPETPTAPAPPPAQGLTPGSDTPPSTDAPSVTTQAPPAATEVASQREGAAFRHLFAPLSSRPFGGKASWRRRPDAAMPHHIDAQSVQAQQMAQAQWDDSMQRLQQSVAVQAAQGTCVIRAQPYSRRVLLQCAEEPDRRRVLTFLPSWPPMTDLTSPSTSAQSAFCWRLEGTTLAPIACEATPANDNGSPQAAVGWPIR